MINPETIQIQTADGVSDSVLFHAQDGAPLPGVLFLTDIVGIRPSQYEMAGRIAGEGYTVLMPNVFYRTGKPPLLDPPVNFNDERTGQRIRELAGAITPEAAERDANAYVDFLAQNHAVSNAPLAAVGFCFSGAMALRVAAARPDRVGAAASFHGGRLFIDDPASPHLLLPQVKAQLCFGHADNDRSMPQDAIDNFDRALAAWGGRYESELYSGAAHGWTVPDSHAYNQPQAERAFTKLMQLLSNNRSAAESRSN